MLKVENLVVQLSDSKKEIIKGVSLTIKPGEIHILNGKNGSGKSTLVNTIMGNPFFTITKGTIKLQDEKYEDHIVEKIDEDNIEGKDFNLTEMEPNERSLLGIFLANQYPLEIPGVSLTSYLRLIFNSRRPKEKQMPVFRFKKYLEEKARLIHYPAHLLKRNLNEGFSGGEKKKTEILQMLILEPKYVMLDEIDSGLDKHSVKEVFEGIVEYKKLVPQSSLIIITHYDRALEYLKPNFIHEMEDGLMIT